MNQKAKYKPDSKLTQSRFSRESALNILSKLTDVQKIVISVVLALIIIGISAFAYNYFANGNFRSGINRIFVPSQDQASVQQDIREQAENLKNLLKETNQNNYYKVYSIDDLDIYPGAWVKRNFNESEQSNTLISAASSDPDGDLLSNKQEYFYGSNPKKKRSLCDGKADGEKPIPTSPFICDERTDKNLVDSNLSPLSGLELDIVPKFKILNQDLSLINNLKDSVEKASEEGVDFPELFQKSRLIDLTDEYNSLQVTQGGDTSENILPYRELRISVLQGFSKEDNTSGLSQIYAATNPEQFDTIKKQYQSQLDRFNTITVPKKYLASHKAYILTFKKLIDLVEIRKNGYVTKTLDTPAYKELTNKKAVEVVWGYRRLQEEQAKLGE